MRLRENPNRKSSKRSENRVDPHECGLNHRRPPWKIYQDISGGDASAGYTSLQESSVFSQKHHWTPHKKTGAVINIHPLFGSKCRYFWRLEGKCLLPKVENLAFVVVVSCGHKAGRSTSDVPWCLGGWAVITLVASLPTWLEVSGLPLVPGNPPEPAQIKTTSERRAFFIAWSLARLELHWFFSFSQAPTWGLI